MNKELLVRSGRALGSDLEGLQRDVAKLVEDGFCDGRDGVRYPYSTRISIGGAKGFDRDVMLLEDALGGYDRKKVKCLIIVELLVFHTDEQKVLWDRIGSYVE